MADMVRQLTQDGIDAFRGYIEATRRGENPGPIPSHLLYRSPYSESLGQHVEIEQGRFVTKYEAAVYFSGVFENIDQKEISYNGGLWSWMSLYYLDELSPKSKVMGSKKFYHPSCYILEVEHGNLNWTQYKYHLLATPFYVYKRHGEESKMLLAGQVSSWKSFTYHLVSRPQFARSREVIKLVNRLYSDSNGNTKSGALEGNPGTLYRLFSVFQQLAFNYDVFNMTCAQMIELLPPEFDQWLNSDNRIPLRETGR